MWLPITVTHFANGVKIRKGNAETMESKPDFEFYISDRDLGDGEMMPISLCHGSEYDSLQDAYSREMEPHYADGYKTEMIFYAYVSQHTDINQSFETIPYAVSHAGCNHGWKYRIAEKRTSADRQWTLDFVFYAYPFDPSSHVSIAAESFDPSSHVSIAAESFDPSSHVSIAAESFDPSSHVSIAAESFDPSSHVSISAGIFDPSSRFPISVGLFSEYSTAKVVSGLSAEDNMFKHDFTFQGFSKPKGDTIPIAVGHAGEDDDRRHRVSKGTHAGDLGWSHDFVFHAFETYKPGTISIAVGHASFRGGWKYRVSKDCKFAGDRGWKHDFVFFVYPFDQSVVTPIAVGFESEFYCARVTQGEIIKEFYFEHAFTFYALKSRCPGTIAVAVGEAGEQANHTLRSIVLRGDDAEKKGWHHQFVFYAFPCEEPGTIPVAVGHADFSKGGWKYRVIENCESAETEGWTHDFVFYVYSHSK